MRMSDEKPPAAPLANNALRDRPRLDFLSVGWISYPSNTELLLSARAAQAAHCVRWRTRCCRSRIPNRYVVPRIASLAVGQLLRRGGQCVRPLGPRGRCGNGARSFRSEPPRRRRDLERLKHHRPGLSHRLRTRRPSTHHLDTRAHPPVPTLSPPSEYPRSRPQTLSSISRIASRRPSSSAPTPVGFPIREGGTPSRGRGTIRGCPTDDRGAGLRGRRARVPPGREDPAPLRANHRGVHGVEAG